MDSTSVSPESTSIEHQIGLKYASRRNSITNSNNTRSSYASQYLRRLQSTSRIRSISNDTKPTKLTSQNKSAPSSSISSSIAHRIELLKKSMNKDQFEVDYSKLDKHSPIDTLSHPMVHKINKETQTNECHLNSFGFHHIHYHHFNTSPFSCIEWRTYFSIVGTLSIIFLLLMDLIIITF